MQRSNQKFENEPKDVEVQNANQREEEETERAFTFAQKLMQDECREFLTTRKVAFALYQMVD